MKIEHKNSGEMFSDFPAYGKHFNGCYGYLNVTYDLQVMFFYSYIGGIDYENVTDQYIIHI